MYAIPYWIDSKVLKACPEGEINPGFDSILVRLKGLCGIHDLWRCRYSSFDSILVRLKGTIYGDGMHA